MKKFVIFTLAFVLCVFLAMFGWTHSEINNHCVWWAASLGLIGTLGAFWLSYAVMLSLGDLI